MEKGVSLRIGVKPASNQDSKELSEVHIDNNSSALRRRKPSRESNESESEQMIKKGVHGVSTGALKKQQFTGTTRRMSHNSEAEDEEEARFNGKI